MRTKLRTVFPHSIHPKAGRLLLSEVRDSIDRHETFALESTLSGKTYVRIFGRAVSLGYDLELHYLWLASVEQAIARVRRRVRMGGHDVPMILQYVRRTLLFHEDNGGREALRERERN
jgi:predicted ABC-type ATPase